MLTLNPRRNVKMSVEVGKDDVIYISLENVTQTDVVGLAERIGREGHLYVNEYEPSKYEYWPPASIRRITWDFDEST